MGNFFGGLMSGASSLISGLFGQQQQKANIAQQDFLAGGGETVAMANSLRAAGINPAGVGGSSFSPPSAVAGDNVMGNAVSSMGHDIGGALSDYANRDTKTDALNQELLQAKVDSAKQEVVGAQLQNSQLARSLAAPGKLPTLKPDGSEVRPYPAYSYYDMGGGHTIRLLSREAAGTQFGPTSLITGPELLPGLLAHQVTDTGNALVRPDVMRSVLNLGPSDVEFSAGGSAP